MANIAKAANINERCESTTLLSSSARTQITFSKMIHTSAASDKLLSHEFQSTITSRRFPPLLPSIEIGTHNDKDETSDLIPILLEQSQKTNQLLQDGNKLLNAIKESASAGDDDDSTDESIDITIASPSVLKKFRDYCTRVDVRMVFLKIGTIDTIKQLFNADVYYEARWREPHLKPSENYGKDFKVSQVDFTEYWGPKLLFINIVQLMNAPNRDKTWYSLAYDEKSDELGPYVILHRRVKAVFFEALELEHFPVDIQDLTLQLSSERSTRELELVMNREVASCVNTRRFTDGGQWILYDHVEVKHDEAKLLFARKPSKRPVLLFQARVARKFWFFLSNIIAILILLVLMTFATYAVMPWTPQFRIGMNLTLVLSTIAFKMVIVNNIPKVDYLTYMDIYVVCDLIYVFLQVTQTCVASAIANNGYIEPNYKVNKDEQRRWRETARDFDMWSLCGFACLIILFHVFYGIRIYISAFKFRRELERKTEIYQRNPLDLYNPKMERAVSADNIPKMMAKTEASLNMDVKC